jgi:hypothetical protein
MPFIALLVGGMNVNGAVSGRIFVDGEYSMHDLRKISCLM